MLPDGTLINGFNLIHAISNRTGRAATTSRSMRSPDKGVTWSRRDLGRPAARRRGHRPRRPATTSAPATSCPTGPWTAARTRPPAATSTWSGWTPASTIPTTTTSCSPARPTAASHGGPGRGRPTPRGVDAFTAMVDVDGQGRVAVSYYDFRNDRPATRSCRPTSGWLTRTTAGRASPTRIGSRRRRSTCGRPRRARLLRRRLHRPDALRRAFHPLWVGANDGNLANRTDVFHQSAE